MSIFSRRCHQPLSFRNGNQGCVFQVEGFARVFGYYSMVHARNETGCQKKGGNISLFQWYPISFIHYPCICIRSVPHVPQRPLGRISSEYPLSRLLCADPHVFFTLQSEDSCWKVMNWVILSTFYAQSCKGSHCCHVVVVFSQQGHGSYIYKFDWATFILH
jgi:hypothetical protein